MYLGALVMLLGVPPALGSWWGLTAVAPMVLVLVSRLRREELYLATNLTGYEAYRTQVKHRLVPHLW
jgi:protein-S-isoprenylcysteine O-methyltransferase Ste14